MNGIASSREPAASVALSLVVQINAEHESCLTAATDALGFAIRCGELLAEAKADVPHGNWQRWLVENFRATARTARMYMQLAANQDKLQNGNGVAVLPIRQAQRQIAEHRPAPGEFPDLSQGEVWVCLGTVGECAAVLQLEQSQRHRGYWYSELWHTGADDTALSMRPMRVDPSDFKIWLGVVSSFDNVPFVRESRWKEVARDGAIIELIDEKSRERAWMLTATGKADTFAEALEAVGREGADD